jgi:hypothetical protein
MVRDKIYCEEHTFKTALPFIDPIVSILTSIGLLGGDSTSGKAKLISVAKRIVELFSNMALPCLRLARYSHKGKVDLFSKKLADLM